MKHWLKNFSIGTVDVRPWLAYGLLALVVLAPLLKPGFILTLDMVFTPHLRMPTTSSNDYLFQVALHVLNIILPSDVIQKTILFWILLLSGVGAYKLMYAVRPRGPSLVGSYVAGILYTVNPFTYDRFVAGQYQVLLGYALLPWFTLLLLRFLAEPTLRRVLWTTACALVISIVSIHSIGLMVVIAVMGLCVSLWQKSGDEAWRGRALRLSTAAVVVFVIASSYWLVPLLLGKGSVASQIAHMSVADQTAFQTVGGGALGRIANVVRLQGFWVEARGMYDLPQSFVPAWGLIGLMVWALVIAGTISLWRARRRGVAMLFVGIMAMGTLLAAGVAGSLLAHIPLLAGYREPQKFAALISLSYAVLGACGAVAVYNYCKEQGGRVFAIGAAILLIALPLAWTPTMLRGFNGQLRPVQYPADWAAINARLGSDSDDFQTLFLPWHLYMYYGFAGHVMASPAPAYFDRPVIVSPDPEFKGAALSNTSKTKQVMNQLLAAKHHGNSFAGQLAKLNIKYIILAHESDYRQYDYITNDPNLQLISKGNTLELYSNNAYRRK